MSDRSEELLEQLIRMVGTMQADLHEVKFDIGEMKQDITTIKDHLKDNEENQIYLAQKIGEHDMFIQKMKNRVYLSD